MSVATSTAIALGLGVSAAASVGSSLIGASAAGSAANTESTAAQKAAALLTAAGQTANTTAGNTLSQEQGLLAPYATVGTTGLNSLTAALAPGGSLTSQFNWNPASIAQDPSYQAQLSLGEQAVQRAAAASGTLNSGGTLKALDQYAQQVTAGYENQDYTQALNTFNTNRSNTVQNLSLPISIGQYGTSGLMSALQQYANLFSSNTLTAAGGAANYGTQAASAQAAGTIGAANAYAGGLNGIGSAASLAALLSTLSGTGAGPSLTNSSGTNGALTIGANGQVVPYSAPKALAPYGNAAPPSAFPISGYPGYIPNVYGAPAGGS